MLGRSSALTLLVLLTLLAAAGPVRAHRLLADYRVLPGGQVRIESWFDITDDPARGARLQVFSEVGRVVFDGQLDEQGQGVFPVPRAEALRVVVSAGAGHRKEIRIPAEELSAPAGGTADPSGGSPPSRPSRPPHEVELPWRDVLIGVGFLLALAAFALGVRNARQLRALGKRPPAEE